MGVKIFSKVEELFPALYEIGEHKNRLPVELRGWVNILGLYVQFWDEYPGTDFKESLAAGGKYRKYFYATCYYDLSEGTQELPEKMVSASFGDFSQWKIKKFDHQVWEKRFAYLIEPTAEIAWYLSIPDKDNPMRTYGSKGDVEKYKMQLLPKLDNAIKHFQSTGEWIGLHNHKCMSCGEDVSWWAYFHCEPCPHCSGKLRE